ncbi:hypothetical protein [Pseudopontixanthobacter vadosimaris]|uniref:hypothetical protein n=1 Tax=Pseudopontixanthobacter vadosimaris TaxID=2726450 RepID=UPI00147459D2|nr:hypothetical protein [Pseudopontixanthobacter vadosimaris]
MCCRCAVGLPLTRRGHENVERDPLPRRLAPRVDTGPRKGWAMRGEVIATIAEMSTVY